MLSKNSKSPGFSGLGNAPGILNRIRKHESGGLRTFADPNPFVLDRAEGSYLFDCDGQRYVDLSSQYAVANIGHNHPAVVEAIRRQAGQLMHCSSAYGSRVRAEFYEALASIAPPELPAIFPAITGAMANEIAVRIALTRRPRGQIVSFSGGYYGRSVGVVGLAAKSNYRTALKVEAQAQFLPYPYPLYMGDDCVDRVMSVLELLSRPGGGLGEIAAVVLEPIQGNGGIVIPPRDFLQKLRQYCDRTGALMVLDEIQSGCGRSGTMWATEHSAIVPDIMTVGKAIGGGLAASAVLGKREIMDWAPDAYSSTFLTNNLNLAAAIAAIGVIRDAGLAERSRTLGDRYLSIVRQRLEGKPGIAEIRGSGLWIAIEFDDEVNSGSQMASRVVSLLKDRKIIGTSGGHSNSVVKIQPPLIISEEDLGWAIEQVLNVIEVDIVPRYTA